MLFKNQDVDAQRRQAFLDGEEIPETLQNTIFEVWSRSSIANALTFEEMEEHLLTISNYQDSHLDEIFALEQQMEKIQYKVDDGEKTIRRLERTLREKQEEVNKMGVEAFNYRCQMETFKKRLEESEQTKELERLRLQLAVQETKLKEYEEDHKMMEQIRGMTLGNGAASGTKRKSGDA
jgi:predicted RNase H-like nuclease (RuvC/YqgF family)